ncbi:MAG: SRPBCC domain-containing protein [Actinomycetota bacterium]|nr:SRPBCC domain-containing protein [Actinomycetota bacterium]
MTDKIERRLKLPTGVERAWQAVTEPAWLARWLADEVELEPWPGGAARFRVGDSERTGWVEELCPPDPAAATPGRLAFWWSEDGEPASRVELTVSPLGESATTIRVVETRPLEILDLVGLPAPGAGGSRYGPTLVAA